MTTPATPAPLPAEAVPSPPDLARQWRAEADAVWSGTRQPLSEADILRRERAKVLRECADEFEAAAPHLAAAAAVKAGNVAQWLAELHISDGEQSPFCTECGRTWPCATMRLADLLRQDGGT